MRKLSGLFITTMLTLSLAALFNGCGGGGASTSRGGGTDATLTASNASQVGDAVTQAVKLVAPGTLGQVKADSVSPEKKAPLMRIFERVAPVLRKQAVDEKHASDILPSEPCPDGGNIELTSVSPDGLSGNVKADVNVNACTIGSEVMNGALKMTVPAAAVTDILHTKEFTIEVKSFTYSDPHSNISLTDNFTMIAKDFKYNGNSLIDGSVTLGGTVVGNIDGNPINIGCDSLGFHFSADTSGVAVSVSGRMNPACLGGWVIIGTNLPVFLPGHASCPTGGEILVSAGGNNVTVHIAADSSITISFNGSVVHTYNSCTEVIGICKI